MSEQKKLLTMIDKALDAASEKVHELLEDKKDMNPAKLERKLRRAFKRKQVAEGTAVGITAALPGPGTIAAAGLSAGQYGLYLTHAARYVLGVAALHGFNIDDDERRRALFLTVLAGEEGMDILNEGLSVSSVLWAKNALTSSSRASLSSLSGRLAKRLTKSGARAATRTTLGRMMPLGVGAVLGWHSGKRLAGDVIDATKEIFPGKPSYSSVYRPA